MRRLHNLLGVLALTITLLVSPVGMALATAPSNDLFANATLAAVGFSETIDTTEATTDAADAQLIETCPGIPTDASVWYAIDGAGSQVLIDTTGSSYQAAIIVGAGSPGNLQTVTCALDLVPFLAEAGTRYYVLVIDPQLDGGGNGGTLSIAVSDYQLPEITLSVDREGQVERRSGVATITGNYTCSAGASFDGFVVVSQGAGRRAVEGESALVGVCDGTPQHWSVAVTPVSGAFERGKVRVTAVASACGVECVGTRIEQRVKLRGDRR